MCSVSDANTRTLPPTPTPMIGLPFIPKLEFVIPVPLVMTVMPLEPGGQVVPDVLVKCNKYVAQVSTFVESGWSKLFKVRSYIDNVRVQTEYKNQIKPMACRPTASPSVLSRIPSHCPGVELPTLLITSTIMEFPDDLDLKGSKKIGSSRKSVIAGTLNLLIVNPLDERCLMHFKYNVASSLFEIYSRIPKGLIKKMK